MNIHNFKIIMDEYNPDEIGITMTNRQHRRNLNNIRLSMEKGDNMKKGNHRAVLNNNRRRDLANKWKLKLEEKRAIAV